MAKGRELEEELFAHIMKELSIDILTFGEQTIMSTGAGTKEEHIDLLVIMMTLQQRLFDMSLKIDTAIFAGNNNQPEFSAAKRLYNQTVDGMDKRLNAHIELLLDNGINVRTVKGE